MDKNQVQNQNSNTEKKLNKARIEVRTPRIDMFESVEDYFIRLSIPGVEKQDLEITLKKDNKLEIKGSVELGIPTKYEQKIAQEIFKGPFKRIIDLPADINKKEVKFNYRGGILQIIIPKIKE